ncbi:MAG: hypothetical protein S0880_33005 [Actinomycetota bacterium]|nr:hypothetical protein [Actinomycetota bacterium]
MTLRNRSMLHGQAAGMPRSSRYQLGHPVTHTVHEAFVAVHRMNAHHGRVYLELAASTGLEGELAEIEWIRRTARGRLVRGFAKTS